MKFLKDRTITLTPRKQLIIGLPILLVVVYAVFFLVSLTVMANTLRKDLEFLKAHHLLFDGELYDERTINGEYAFVITSMRNGEQVAYVCTPSDVQITKHRLAMYKQSKAMGLVTKKLMIAGVLKEDGMMHELDGYGMVMKSCMIFKQ